MNVVAKLKIITVVIDPAMYERFFSLNPVLKGCDLVSIDNRQFNRGLPIIYNELIARYLDEDCWLLFVHEDYEIKAGLSVVDTLDKTHVYGTFGLNFENNSPAPMGAIFAVIKMEVVLWRLDTWSHSRWQFRRWIAKVSWCTRRFCIKTPSCVLMSD